MRKLVCAWAVAGAAIALAQNGSIEGAVVDSATQSPIRKAQVILMYRGPSPGSAVPVGSIPGSGGGSSGAVLAPSGVIAAGRLRAGISSAGPGMTGPMMIAGPGGQVGQPSTAVTDSGGSFSFRDVTPGMYAVQALHPRYPIRPTGPALAEVEVKGGESAHVNVVLTPGASMTGRVVDEDGEPLSGCSVQLRSTNPRQPWGPSMGSEMSNEKGEYRVYALTPGRYIAFATCGRPVFQPRPFSSGPPTAPTLGYPVIYYPQTLDLSAATPIEIAAGAEQTGIDFQLKPTRTYAVTGTVSGYERQPNRQLMVSLTLPGQQNMPFSNRGGRVDPQTGAFDIQNVFPGSYVLIASQFSPDMNGTMLTARQTVEVTDRPLQVSLILQKPADIPGAFIIDGNPDVQKQQLHLAVMPDVQAGPLSPPRVEPQSDGSFVLRNTPPGRWVLNVYGAGVYLKAVEVGGQIMQGNVLDTTSGAPGALRVVVSTRTARVEGRGKPGSMYALIRDDADPRMLGPFVGHADPQGVVRVQGLAPGKYGVFEGTVPDEAKRLDTITLVEDGVLEVDFAKRSGQ